MNWNIHLKFFYKSEIIFCPDICDEIPWLKKISSSFSYATAGIMFCCSTESEEQFKNLDGFPMDILITRALLQKQKNKTEIEIENITENSSVTNTEQTTILDADVDATTTNYNENKDNKEIANNNNEDDD